LCFFSSIRVDPGPYIVTSPENTYPRGKHGEIKVHRSNACVLKQIILESSNVQLYLTVDKQGPESLKHLPKVCRRDCEI
jgi:hypothetical protein